MLYALLALVSAIAAGCMFYLMQTTQGDTLMYIIIGAVCVLLTVVFGVMFMTKRVNQTEEIHVTE